MICKNGVLKYEVKTILFWSMANKVKDGGWSGVGVY